MSDFDLSRSPSPQLLPAALEFLRMLGVPQPAPQPVIAPQEARVRSAGKPQEQRVEHAIELLRQLSQELLKNPPTLHEQVRSNPTAQGIIYRRSLFVADEIEIPEQAPVTRKPQRERAGKAG